ncbi:MAG: hypothetical protein ACKN89_13055 [Cyanobium sp.]
MELLITATSRKGTGRTTRHLFITSIRTRPEALLRTIVMNLLRRSGYRSIRQGFRELAYDIQGMLALGGVTIAPEAA